MQFYKLKSSYFSKQNSTSTNSKTTKNQVSVIKQMINKKFIGRAMN